MKTYKKEVEAQRLEIYHDPIPESPREWSNLGYFITHQRKYRSPDDNKIFEEVIVDMGIQATDGYDHAQKVKEQLTKDGYNVVLVVPISKYEHGGIIYSIGDSHGFDSGVCGMYIVLKEGIEELGIQDTSEENLIKIINQELDTYNAHANGQVFGFTLYDSEGNIEESCCGFYDIDDIAAYLPEEFEGEFLEDYII